MISLVHGTVRRLMQQAGSTQGSAGSQTQPVAAQYLSPSLNGYDFNWYSTFTSGLTAVTTGAQATALSNLQITAAYDFYWVASTFKVDIAGFNGIPGSVSTYPDYTEATALDPRILVSITDTGSGRILTPNPVPIGQLAGARGQPYRLIIPRLLRGTSVLQFSFTPYGYLGTTTAITYDYIYFTLHGFVVPAGSAYPL
jgi:hypothetical protein